MNAINHPISFSRRMRAYPITGCSRSALRAARLDQRDGELWAEPVFGKSNLIYTMAHADGILHVPLDLAGLYAGEIVTVRIF